MSDFRRLAASSMLAASLLFLFAYTIASALDLWTTHLALSLSRVHEGNAFAVDRGGYDAVRAWTIAGVAAIPIVGLFAFGMANLHSISERWLDRPLRSFLSLRSNIVFMLPWSKRVIDRSPLHALAFAIAFVVLRLLAALNNLIIAAGGQGPLGLAVQWVAQRTSAVAGFTIAMGTIYLVLVLMTAVIAARTIKAMQRNAHAMDSAIGERAH